MVQRMMSRLTPGLSRQTSFLSARFSMYLDVLCSLLPRFVYLLLNASIFLFPPFVTHSMCSRSVYVYFTYTSLSWLATTTNMAPYPLSHPCHSFIFRLSVCLSLNEPYFVASYDTVLYIFFIYGLEMFFTWAQQLRTANGLRFCFLQYTGRFT